MFPLATASTSDPRWFSELFFATITNDANHALGNAGSEGGSSRLLWGRHMWMLALFCAALGASLSVRHKVFALVPASLIVLGLTVICGVVSHWGVFGIVLATIANIVVLQMSYCVGGLIVQLFGKRTRRRGFDVRSSQAALRRVFG